jgi:Tfp pilus assembly protein PilV
LFAPDHARHGFSLTEVLIAFCVISFALFSILGVLSIAMTVHEDASNDSVFSFMTETALQEVRNYNATATSLAPTATPTYSFGKLAPGYTGYIYFDADGQITMDSYRQSTSTLTTQTSTASGGTQSTDIGIFMTPGTLNSSNNGNASLPLTGTLTLANLPPSTYFVCTITTQQPTLANGATSSMYVVQLTYVWPPQLYGNNPPASHTRTVFSSISNNIN